MAILEDGILGANGMTTGLLVGIGAAILVPALFPVVATAAKPLVKGAIKLGVTLYEKGNEAVAEVSEVIEDLVAEAKSEMAAAESSVAAAATAVKGGNG
ncbi:MAG TPA: DUF5132 domain-containing protein [Terriglobales bacterium]|jgi:hypothetical protein|nr:DUF5132 domain-containing protein [Terriglobales bacterium]